MPLQLTQLRRDVTGEFVARPRKNAADAGGAANSVAGKLVSTYAAARKSILKQAGLKRP
jgi:hypothetical protein